MKPIIKFFLYAGLCLSILSICTIQAFAAPETITEDDITDVSIWRMVWIKDFAPIDWPYTPEFKIKAQWPELQRKDLPQRLETYIRSVNIHTAVINGELVTTRASAGCNGMGRSTHKVVVTPARTVEIFRDGKPQWETIPATYETETGWFTTQKACSIGLKIEGKLHDTNWIAMMENFIMANGNKVSHSRIGETLEWKNSDGTIIARFEKLPDIVMHKHLWRLDPDVHEYDPVIKRYFGAANISISYPKLSSYTFCGPISAPIDDVTDQLFKLSDEMWVNPCGELSYLVNGQRFPYTPNDNAVHNLLARHLPNVAQYAVSETGDTRRLALSDEDGNTLIKLISTGEGPWRSQLSQARIYDELDDYEWNIETSQIMTSNVIEALNPIRIFSHHGYMKDGPKTQAAIISVQNCAISGLNIRGQSANTYKPFGLKDYDKCEEVAANALAAELGETKKLLFDETYLIFYDDEWNEVMRAKRGKSLMESESP